jgi:hypothetical protein
MQGGSMSPYHFDLGYCAGKQGVHSEFPASFADDCFFEDDGFGEDVYSYQHVSIFLDSWFAVLTQVLLTQLTLDSIYPPHQRLNLNRRRTAGKLAQISDRVDRIIDVQHLVVVKGANDVEHPIYSLDM